MVLSLWGRPRPACGAGQCVSQPLVSQPKAEEEVADGLGWVRVREVVHEVVDEVVDCWPGPWRGGLAIRQLNAHGLFYPFYLPRASPKNASGTDWSIRLCEGLDAACTCYGKLPVSASDAAPRIRMHVMVGSIAKMGNGYAGKRDRPARPPPCGASRGETHFLDDGDDAVRVGERPP